MIILRLDWNKLVITILKHGLLSEEGIKHAIITRLEKLNSVNPI